MDVIGLHLTVTSFISGKGEARFFAAGLGWAFAHSIANYFVGLLIGARTAGFQWTFVQTALESNIDLVFYASMAALVWIFSRNDLQRTVRNCVLLMIVACVLQKVVYQ